MEDLNKVYLYRMTHVENIPHILQFGITHINSPNRNSGYISIGDGNLIDRRTNHNLPDGTKLGAYIPFYFGSRMPMLYVIEKGFSGVKETKPENIVYCITSVQMVIDHNINFVFSNGHAIDGFTEFYSHENVGAIKNLVDQNAIKVRNWKVDNDLDLKRRMEAEFLIANDLPVSAILGFAVYNEFCKKRLVEFGVLKQIVVKKEYYF